MNVDSITSLLINFACFKGGHPTNNTWGHRSQPPPIPARAPRAPAPTDDRASGLARYPKNEANHANHPLPPNPTASTRNQPATTRPGGQRMSDTEPTAFTGIEAYYDDEADMDAVESTCFLLSNKHRQYVVLFLLAKHTADTVTAGEMATWIVAVETNTTLRQVPSDQRRSVRTTLISNHLPKLDEADVIDHESVHHYIKPGARFAPFARSLLQLLTTISYRD